MEKAIHKHCLKISEKCYLRHLDMIKESMTSQICYNKCSMSRGGLKVISFYIINDRPFKTNRVLSHTMDIGALLSVEKWKNSWKTKCYRCKYKETLPRTLLLTVL